MPALRLTAVVWVALAAVVLAGCAVADSTDVDRAKARVTAEENAVTEAQAELTAASGAFCDASKDYVLALDRYGDVLNSTAPTVGDVREGGADLAEPRDDAYDGAEAAVEAQQAVATAEQELADARAALAVAEAGPSGTPVDVATELPAPTPLAPVGNGRAGQAGGGRIRCGAGGCDRPDAVDRRVRAVQQCRRRARDVLAPALRRCGLPARRAAAAGRGGRERVHRRRCSRISPTRGTTAVRSTGCTDR